MTNITIKRKNKEIVSVESSGHTEYNIDGEDVLCASLSSIMQTALLGLMQVAGISVSYKRNDKDGVLNFSLPELNEDSRYDANLILDTMLCGITDLYDGFSDYIDLSIVEV